MLMGFPADLLSFLSVNTVSENNGAVYFYSSFLFFSCLRGRLFAYVFVSYLSFIKRLDPRSVPGRSSEALVVPVVGGRPSQVETDR